MNKVSIYLAKLIDGANAWARNVQRASYHFLAAQLLEMVSYKAACIIINCKAACIIIYYKAACIVINYKAAGIVINCKAACILINCKAACIVIIKLHALELIIKLHLLELIICIVIHLVSPYPDLSARTPSERLLTLFFFM